MKNSTTVNKQTPTEHPILDSIKNRWSPRTFADTPISESDVQVLLEAGRWAPSSSNIQPWRIIWGIKGTETYDRIFDCLDEFNQSWAGNSQVLWINAFKKTMKDGTKENFHALHDLGLFMGNVIHQANSMGIASHQMAGLQFKKAQSEFNFTEDYHVATAVAFGYYGGSLDNLPEDLQRQEEQKMRKRKNITEFAFNGNFKNNS
ncbi:nitroreductase family protein [Aequorivita flava]|uniref:Nitroreductase family protein n=1 Tax=Aequorivita flava TaxID=3114371 RepID=A0AB35YNV0_9FLAO